MLKNLRVKSISRMIARIILMGGTNGGVEVYHHWIVRFAPRAIAMKHLRKTGAPHWKQICYKLAICCSRMALTAFCVDCSSLEGWFITCNFDSCTSSTKIAFLMFNRLVNTRNYKRNINYSRCRSSCRGCNKTSSLKAVRVEQTQCELVKLWSWRRLRRMYFTAGYNVVCCF